MSKSRKQMLAAVLVLTAFLGCYFGARKYSANLSKKQQEEEAASIVQATDFDVAEVTAFSYTSAGLEVSFSLNDGEWKNDADASLKIDTEKIESFLENFNAIESDNEIADSENREEFGLQEPNSSITFQFSDGESLTCSVGDYNDVMGVYYFMTDAGDSVYTVSGTVANKLSNTADNFIAEEEETEEETEAKVEEETEAETEAKVEEETEAETEAE